MIYAAFKRARDLIISRGWTQKAYARDSVDRQVNARNHSAQCYCMIGALIVATGDDTPTYNACFCRIVLQLKGDDPFEWNDSPSTTKEQVIALYNRVIDQV